MHEGGWLQSMSGGFKGHFMGGDPLQLCINQWQQLLDRLHRPESVEYLRHLRHAEIVSPNPAKDQTLSFFERKIFGGLRADFPHESVNARTATARVLNF